MDTDKQAVEEDPSNEGSGGARAKLLAALATDADVTAACAAAGIGRTTGYRWLREPAFQEELARQRNDVLTDALGRVKVHAVRAVARLAELAESRDERVSRQACHDLIAQALKTRELEDLERRITALERAAAEKKEEEA